MIRVVWSLLTMPAYDLPEGDPWAIFHGVNLNASHDLSPRGRSSNPRWKGYGQVDAELERTFRSAFWGCRS